MPASTIKDRLDTFYEGLPESTVQSLREYGFDEQYGKVIIEGAATALLKNSTFKKPN